MHRRLILMLVAIVVFITAIGYIKFHQIQQAIANSASFQPPPDAVTTIVAALEHWQSSVQAIGSVEAVKGVMVSADLSGIVKEISFESGKAARAGDVLVELETSQEHAQLAAAEAQRDLDQVTLERIRGLRDKGVASQEEYDQAAAEARQAESRANEIRATIARKTIRAPFDGILGIRRVNPGQYLKEGDPVVPLQSLRPVYVNFAVPQQQLDGMRPGMEVRIATEAIPRIELAGKITAIDAIVDETTRNVKVQATFNNLKGELRPGMFVEVRVILPGGSQVVELPASAIRYAPYGDAVFIVQKSEAHDGRTPLHVRQQFVKLGGTRGDQVAVITGVNPGDVVVTSGVFKLYNGAAVQINNEVQPGNNPAPQPKEN